MVPADDAPLSPAPADAQRVRGCGVQGCLIAAVALFVVLLVGLLVLAGLRLRDRPTGGRQLSAAAEAPPPRLLPPCLPEVRHG